MGYFSELDTLIKQYLGDHYLYYLPGCPYGHSREHVSVYGFVPPKTFMMFCDKCGNFEASRKIEWTRTLIKASQDNQSEDLSERIEGHPGHPQEYGDS